MKMITLKQLQLHNFLSHCDTNIAFWDNNKILIDGKSGSGKTSIVEAIIWGLYGEARCSNKDLIKHGEKTGSVTINLFNESNEIHYEIKRTTTDKAKNTLTISFSMDGLEWKPIERNGLRDIQEWINNDLLHASYTLFINSIAYPQDNANNFVKQTATKRKDLLLEIANVGDFDLYYSRAKDILLLKTEEKARIESSISTNLSFIEKQKELIIDEESTQKEIGGIELSIGVENQRLTEVCVKKQIINDSISEINKLKSQILTKQGESTLLSTQLVNKKTAIDTIKNIDIQNIKDKISEGEILKKKGAILDEKINKDYERTNKLNVILADRPSDRDYDGEVMEINQRLIPLIKETSKCPSGDKCPFTIPIQNQITYLSDQINEKIGLKAKLEKERALFTAKINELGPSTLLAEEVEESKRLTRQMPLYAGYAVQLARIEAQIATLPFLEAEYSEMLIRETNLNGETFDLVYKLKGKTDTQLITDTAGLDAEEDKIRSEISSLERIVMALSNKKSISQNAGKTINKIEFEIKSEQGSLSKVKSLLESISAIKEAFGGKGLRTIVIDLLIPRLEDKINEILGKLSDFRVQLDTQREAAGGEGNIEGLFINIFNERGEQFELSSYSGGEKLKITVAISEALASLQKCGFRIFDELFIGLDEESVEHFAEVVSQLQEKFKQILCISHLRTIKDLFDDKITIVKINGTSQMV